LCIANEAVHSLFFFAQKPPLAVFALSCGTNKNMAARFNSRKMAGIGLGSILLPKNRPGHRLAVFLATCEKNMLRRSTPPARQAVASHISHAIKTAGIKPAIFIGGESLSILELDCEGNGRVLEDI
jgi:hypothetical protein